MPDVLLPIQPGNLPPNYCWTSWQKFAVDLAAIFFAKLSGQAFYSIGSTKPDVEFNSYPWFNTTDGRWYTFSGSWIAPHPYQLSTSSGLRLEWEGTEGDLALFDGGDATSPSNTSGPMWEIDHDYDGRSSMGPGLISGSDPAAPKTLALSEDYGEGSHVLTQPELPDVTFGNKAVTQDAANSIWGSSADGTKSGKVYGNDNGLVTENSAEVPILTTVQSGGADTPHQNTHPIRGCYKVKRTGRIYYTVP